MNHTPRFWQMKDLTNIYICGKFHQYSIWGCDIKNFQSFLYWFSIHEMAPFWDFWLLFPRLLFNLDEILTRGSSIRQTHCLKNPSKFWKLAQMEPTESLWFWSILKPNYRWKTKNLLKTKISANTASLGISNNISSRFQKNHRIRVKLSKKKKSGGSNWVYIVPMRLCQSVIRNSHITYNSTFHLYFQLLDICCSQLYP